MNKEIIIEDPIIVISIVDDEYVLSIEENVSTEDAIVILEDAIAHLKG